MKALWPKSFTHILVGAILLLFVLITLWVARGLIHQRVQTQAGDERYFGRIVEAEGNVKRQGTGQFAFESIDVGDSVQTGDSLITDRDAGATLELAGGERFRVNPGVLIHLEFAVEKEVWGVSRVPDLEILRGSVEAIPASNPVPNLQKSAPRIRAGNEVVRLGTERVVISQNPLPRPSAVAPALPPALRSPPPLPSFSPSPSPSPSLIPPLPKRMEANRPRPVKKIESNGPPKSVTLLSPQAGQTLNAGPLTFQWQVDPPTALTEVLIEQVDSASGSRTRIAAVKVSAGPDGIAQWTQKIDRSGDYSFSIRNADDEVLKGLGARVDFEIQVASELAHATAVIEAGASLAQRSLGISWKAPVGATHCQLQVWDQPNTAAIPRIDEKVGVLGSQKIPVGLWRTPRAFFKLICSGVVNGIAGKKFPPLGPVGAVLFPQAPEVHFRAGNPPALEWKAIPFADRYELRPVGTKISRSVKTARADLPVAEASQTRRGWELRAWYGTQAGPWSKAALKPSN